MPDEPYNGLPPFVAGVETSETAALSIAEDANQLREFVRSVIARSGAAGMTCDEVETETNLRHQTASARIRELVQKNQVTDSGRKRPTSSGRPAIVWITREEAVANANLLKGPAELQPTLFQIDPKGQEGLDGLRKRCLVCTKCDLSKTRTNAVFGEGNPNSPDVLFLGEGPGGTEDEEGRPFVGISGRKLDQIIRAMGLQRADVYITNAVACRPPGNRPPERYELDACREFMVGQIRAVKPKTIVALGVSAVNALLRARTKKKISDLRGKWIEWEGIPVMPTYHPSAICRAETSYDGMTGGDGGLEMKRLVWADMQMVLTKLGRRPQ